jgi:hypothetical protein
VWKRAQFAASLAPGKLTSGNQSPVSWRSAMETLIFVLVALAALAVPAVTEDLS